MFKSKSVLALCTTKFTYGVGFSIVVTCFPMYIKGENFTIIMYRSSYLLIAHLFIDLTNAEIYKVGVFSSLPNVISAFTVPMVGFMADYLQNKGVMTTTQVRR